MTDLRTLTDAFTELEHRAEAFPVSTTDVTTFGVGPKPHRQRALLVAASTVGVAAMAGGVVLLANTGADHSSAPAGGPSAASTSPSSVAPTPSSSAPAPRPSGPTRTSSRAPRINLPNAPQPSGSPASTAPTGGDAATAALVRQLRAALGGNAQVSVTDTSTEPGDPSIVGVLTVDGHRGGFDLQTLGSGRGTKASCDDADTSHCRVRSFADHSSLATGHEAILGGGVTLQAQFVRADGRTALMHVSNERDPKGESAKLGANPPLTGSKMATIVRNPRILAIN